MKRRELSSQPMGAHRHSAPSVSPLYSQNTINNNTYQRRHSSVSSSSNFQHDARGSNAHQNQSSANPWMVHSTVSTNSYYSRYDNSLLTPGSYKSLLWKLAPCIILMIVPWIPCQQTKWQIQESRLEVEKLIKDQKRLVKDLDVTTDGLKKLRLENEKIAKETDEAFRELHKNDNDSNAATVPSDLENELYLEAEDAEENFLNRINQLEKHIQEQSAKRIQNRYGSGPIRVKVTVEEASPSSWRPKSSSFIIQLAMLVEMPYSVDHFLQMVEAKLWNGLSLVHGSGSDVILATPMTLDSHEWAGQRFIEANLTHMAFTEFSPTYPPPHQHKYSVAFSGRPGGPDFYVSLEDDLESHYHESTFGTVVEGRDVLDRFLVQRDETVHKNRAKRMKIVSMDVIA